MKSNMNKKAKIKPRTMIVNVHINEGETIETNWDQVNQKLSLKVKQGEEVVSARKIESTIQYERAKKPKILNKIEFSRSSEFTVSSSDALKSYNQVWGIDTNRKDLFGYFANVSGITVCSTDGEDVFYPVASIIFGQTKGNPELFGWRKFIEFVVNNEKYDSNSKYGLIVDSELSEISAINDGNVAIHGDFYLPSNWKLIYATSDSGKDSILNKVISESDKTSTKVLDKLAARKSNEESRDFWAPIVDEENANVGWFFLPRDNG
ncbi:hypothetical protein ABMX65_22720 [Vibrio vulnificus]|uniref:hypothetical protein n=1 Tax=Vibrio vulnificus TaxID=672 RepID=UPI002A458FBC|nr:hypothetical protein [Vibrio sp. 1180_3]